MRDASGEVGVRGLRQKLSVYLKRVTSPIWLAAVAFPVVAPVFATSACAADQTVPSRWVGVYEGLSRGCSGHPLMMSESTVSWVDCKRVKIRVSAVSDTELLLEVNREAKCGLAGLLMSLRRSSAEGQAVEVTT